MALTSFLTNAGGQRAVGTEAAVILTRILQEDDCYLTIDRRIILNAQPGPYSKSEMVDTSDNTESGIDDEDDEDDEVSERCMTER